MSALVLKAGKTFPPTQFENPWAIWIDQASVLNRKGLITDDTAFRLCLLHPWLVQLQKPIRQTLQASGMGSFFTFQPQPQCSHSSVHASCLKQQAEWLAMYQACQQQQANSFYRKDSPMAFGLFQCLDLALFFINDPIEQVFSTFKSINPLDQRYGKLITGLVAVLIAKAFNQQSANRATLQQCIHQTIIELNTFPFHDTEQQEWNQIVSYYQQAIHFAGQPFESDYQFLESIRQNIFLNPAFAHFNLENQGRNNHDPLLFWFQLISALQYAQFDVLHTLQLLSSGTGDADTLASIAGFLLGAWHGAAYFDQLADSTPLHEALHHVKTSIRFMFDIDLEERAIVLAKLMHPDSLL
ncbi:MAG: ADP-ribosylglycohydrolase family protein [Flammeovirgaceae bacterium]